MVSVPMHVLRICSCGIFAYPRCIHDLRHGVLSLLQTGVHVRLGGSLFWSLQSLVPWRVTSLLVQVPNSWRTVLMRRGRKRLVSSDGMKMGKFISLDS